MSFRELRDTCEILRALSYPRLVSIENFRFPNFPLMAEVLEWTVRKFDPIARVPSAIDTETDRVVFVKACVLILINRAHVRLNPKELYQSDGHAVRELLPVLRILYQTVGKRPTQSTTDGSGQASSSGGGDISINELRAKVNNARQEIRRSVQLASELPHSGANIYDLLAKEMVAKEARSKALSVSMNSSEVEAAMRGKIDRSEKRIADFHYKLDNLTANEQDLEKKIERRRREYEQLQKRLAKLQSFRPPYMDEYERHEARLKELYAEYVVLFRNLSHLQQQVYDVERAEKDRSARAEMDMRLAVEKIRIENEAISRARERSAGDALERQLKEARIFGNMTGAGFSDEEDEDGEDVDDGREYEEEEDEDYSESNSGSVKKVPRKQGISDMGRVGRSGSETARKPSIAETDPYDHSEDDF